VAGAAVVDDDLLPSRVRIVWTVDSFSLSGLPSGVVTLSWVISSLAVARGCHKRVQP
jgi:hypothetical protein